MTSAVKFWGQESTGSWFLQKIQFKTDIFLIWLLHFQRVVQIGRHVKKIYKYVFFSSRMLEAKALKVLMLVTIYFFANFLHIPKSYLPDHPNQSSQVISCNSKFFQHFPNSYSYLSPSSVLSTLIYHGFFLNFQLQLYVLIFLIIFSLWNNF